ncbi:MAG: sulfotransferase [Holophagales bacterium]|nr:sulfotransferase [Holophagales bacterium]
MSIPPVLILSTGRCGSTMLTDVLNLHPRVLSVSEFFSAYQLSAFGKRRPRGDDMWRLYSVQSRRTRLALRETFHELLYPFGDPEARYTLRTVPPIMAITLPNLTDRYEELYGELEPVVRAQPRQSPADHFRQTFSWLCQRFDRSVWVERSGGSLLVAPLLVRNFPDARVIHIYRDGRDTSVSLAGHPAFRGLLAKARRIRAWGVDPVKSMPLVQRFNRLGCWMDNLADMFIDQEKLPYDAVTLADFAAFWNGLIEVGRRTFADLPSERLLNVKFEDVQAEPRRELQRIIRFISPELDDPDWLRSASAIPRPQVRSRFDELDGAEQAAIIQACRPGLELLDYPI